MKSAAAIAIALLLVTGVHAEQRHHTRPAPPPAPVVPPVLSTGGPTTLPPPPPPSPFAARPGTYAPHYNEPAPRTRGYGAGYGYGLPYYDSAAGIGGYVTAPSDLAPSPDAPPPAASPEPPRAPAPVPEPPRVAVVRGPDTFYVIPGCYAGNHPPNPARLPKGCDAAKVRTLPVR